MNHGTNHGYDSGCRCDACRGFKREKDRARRERRKGQAGNPPNIPHGTPAGYDKHYCRCRSCIEANKKYRSAWLTDHPEKVAGYMKGRTETRDEAYNAGKEWTGAELEQVIRRDIPLTELAQRLGRSYDACSVARAKAEHDPKWIAVVGTPGAIS